MNWNDQKTTKKGNLGERLVDKYLIDKNCIIYAPICDGSHPTDRIAYSKKTKELFFLDTKTKPRRIYYQDTQIDTADLDHYLELSEQYKFKFFLFFVDDLDKKIYGGEIHDLLKPVDITYNGKTTSYPFSEMCNGESITYFPLANMKTYTNLTDIQAEKFADLSSN